MYIPGCAGVLDRIRQTLHAVSLSRKKELVQIGAILNRCCIIDVQVSPHFLPKSPSCVRRNIEDMTSTQKLQSSPFRWKLPCESPSFIPGKRLLRWCIPVQGR